MQKKNILKCGECLGKKKVPRNYKLIFLMPLVRFQAPKRHIYYTGEGTLELSTYKRKFNVALYVGTASLKVSYFDASTPGKKFIFFCWRSIIP